jgi:hypothetical protein
MPEKELTMQVHAPFRGHDVNEKSGKLKFAFSWNLLGGAPTQGQTAPRKEIPLHGAEHIGTQQTRQGNFLADA